mmetsp:Transcript_6115/g.8908  ORF Transcript_6115/g.8908 Transcript_6115/m.8908 type:complete len:104 (-) Transcript_6115:1033-1344(-)
MNRPDIFNDARIIIDDAQPRAGWKTFQFKVAEFGDYEGREGNDWLETPLSPSTGDEWSLQIYPDPGRYAAATAGYLSVYLKCCHPRAGQNAAMKVEIKILDNW